MGGKHKQIATAAQRTKGNVKPSSSTRAAVLLEACGATATGFVGFGAFSEGLGCVGSSQDRTGDVDVDFSLVMKKLAKRDPTTKLKGMQEFSSLCREKDVDAVVSVLPFWPKIFTRLSTDHDRRVREATSIAFGQLVLRIRRNLAPHLKNLMGPWLIAQCDAHAPAATAAEAAFTSAFSPAKQAEAIGFCKIEILEHIADYLIDQTAQSLSDPKTTEVDEMESKYNRLLASSLEAYRLFLSIVSSEQHLTIADNHRVILRNTKFWKFGKHSIGPVRAGFYASLSSLCTSCPSLAEEFSEQICPSVLYTLDESDPCVVRSLWEAVLVVMTTVKNFWSMINARKGMYPKLWSVLKNGGSGCAVTIFPNILPFVGCLPSTETTGEESRWFWESLFDNMRLGLLFERVLLSPSECSAIVESFIECIRCCIALNLQMSAGLPASSSSAVAVMQPTSTLLDDVVKKHLIPLMDISLTKDCLPALAIKSLYSSLVHILLYLRKNRNTVVDPTSTEIFTKLYNVIVGEISIQFLAQLENCNAAMLTKLANFVQNCMDVKSTREAVKSSVGVVAKRQNRKKGANTGNAAGSRSVRIGQSVTFKDTAEDGSKGLASEVSSDTDIITEASYGNADEGEVNSGILLADHNDMMWQFVCQACSLSLLKSRTGESDSFTTGSGDRLNLTANEFDYLELFMRIFLTLSGDIDLVTYIIEHHQSINTTEKTATSVDTTSFTSKPSIMLTFVKTIVFSILSTPSFSSKDKRAEKSIIQFATKAIERLVNANEKSYVLESLLEQKPSDSVLYYFLIKSISLECRDDTTVLHWLHGKSFGEFVVRCALELFQHKCCYKDSQEANSSGINRGRWEVVSLVLTSVDKKDEPIICISYIKRILEMALTLTNHNHAVASPGIIDLTASMNVVCDIVSLVFLNLYSHAPLAEADALLLSLFPLVLQVDGNVTISASTLERTEQIWWQGLHSFLTHNRKAKAGLMGTKITDIRFIADIIKCLTSFVSNKMDTVKLLHHYCNVAVQLRDAAAENFECLELCDLSSVDSNKADKTFADALTSNIFSTVRASSPVQPDWLSIAHVCGKLACDSFPLRTFSGSFDEYAIKTIGPISFVAQYIVSYAGTVTALDDFKELQQESVFGLKSEEAETDFIKQNIDEQDADMESYQSDLFDGVPCEKEKIIFKGIPPSTEPSYDLSNCASADAPVLEIDEKCVDDCGKEPDVSTSTEQPGTTVVTEQVLLPEEVNVSVAIPGEDSEDKTPLHMSNEAEFSADSNTSHPLLSCNVSPKIGSSLAVNIDCDLILDVAVALSCSQFVLSASDPSSSSASGELVQFASMLENNFMSLLGLLNPEDGKRIIAVAFQRSMTDGGQWSLALVTLLKAREHFRLHWDYQGLIADRLEQFSEVSLKTAMTLQAALPKFMKQDILTIMEMRGALLATCPVQHAMSPTGGCTGHLAVLNAALSIRTDDDSKSLAPSDNTSQFNKLAYHEMSDVIKTVFSQINEWREQTDFLTDLPTDSLTDAGWAALSFNIELIRFISASVSHAPSALTAADWDTVLCATVSWLQHVNEWHECIATDFKALSFAIAVFDLCASIAECLQMRLSQEPDDFPLELAAEWRDVFCGSIFDVLLPLYVQLVEFTSVQSMKCLWEAELLLRSASLAVVYCPDVHLVENRLRPKLMAADVTQIPDKLQTLLNTLCPALSSNRRRCVQIAAYHLLLKIVPQLSKYDEGAASPEADMANNEDCIKRTPPRALISGLDASRATFSALFTGAEFGHSVSLGIGTVEHSGAFGYLLCWRLLLQFFDHSSSELRSEYAAWLSSCGVIDRLINDLFHIMPNVSSTSALSSMPTNVARISKTNMSANELLLKDVRTCLQLLKKQNKPSQVELHKLACFVYTRLLASLPAVARQWWNSQNKITSSIVDRYTTRFVSPLLCAQELATVASVSTAAMTKDGMTVKARPALNDIIATYVKEESRLELVITLPANMPFGAISVESSRRLGVDAKQWRNWMLQLIIFLTYQNGSIVDGLALWKRNVDKRFEGLDDCMICFSVIHGTNYQLPKLQCKTCRKRFHSICLYKWFNTSHNSVCPLCRNLF